MFCEDKVVLSFSKFEIYELSFFKLQFHLNHKINQSKMHYKF